MIKTRYQLNNHLESASLELDENADIISYEEYYPFGSTSYRAGRSNSEVNAKRYRYVGKEKDNETGLYYYGARYYASWLARFVSVDPLKDDYPFYTSYQYAGNKPVTFTDLDGQETTDNQTTNVQTNGQQKKDFIEFRSKVAATQKVGDADDFLSGLSGFAHNALILIPNIVSEGINSGIDVINYVAEEFEDPGSKRPLDELAQGIEDFGEFLADDTERFFNQPLSKQGRELLNAAIDPTTYKLPIEIALTKKLAIPKKAPSIKVKQVESLTVKARRLGKEGEKAAGIRQGVKEKIESITETAKFRIPDELDRQTGVLREIKNVKSLSNTSQIKDFRLFAEQENIKFILETRPDTKLSKPLQTLIKENKITHIKNPKLKGN